MAATAAGSFGQRIEGSRIDAGLVSSTRWVVPTDRLRPEGLSAAFDGRRSLLVWGNADGIWGVLVEPAASPGQPLLLFPPADPTAWHSTPADVALSFDGRNYVLAWTDGDELRRGETLRVARVSPEGVVLDPGGILVRGASRPPNDSFQTATVWGLAAASNGQETLVVWSAGMDFETRAARLRPDGSLLDPGGVTIRGLRGASGVVWDGTGYVVVGSDPRGDSDVVPREVRGVRVDRRLGATPLFAVPVEWSARRVGIASNENRLLVVWSEPGTPVAGAALVASDGTLLGPAPLSIGAGLPSTVAPDDSGFLVVSKDAHDSDPDSPGVDYSRIYLTHVGRDGEIGRPVLIRP